MDAETERSDGPGQLRVSVDPFPPGHLVRVAGELDFDSAHLLNDALDTLLAERSPRVVIDCSRLSFCDSTGLNLLLKTRASAEAVGSAMVLTGMPPIMTRLFEITGVQQVFDVFDTAREAMAGRDGS